jgi:hypothetical protein
MKQTTFTNLAGKKARYRSVIEGKGGKVDGGEGNWVCGVKWTDSSEGRSATNGGKNKIGRQPTLLRTSDFVLKIF